MDDSKRLFFIPILAKAVQIDDQRQAMQDAFDEIRELGKRPEYEEGFHQFFEFINTSLKLPSEEPGQKIQMIRNAIHHLIYDLATDTFEGDEEQRDALIATLRGIPEWNQEYERIEEEAKAFVAPDSPTVVEVLKGDQIIGSFPMSKTPITLRSITPGSYTIRLSNGRVLWQGDLLRNDLIWAYAYPGKDLAMAAKTESRRQQPTRTLPLLDRELTMQVFAGLESGEMRITSGTGS
jgi:hypothetical protein